MIMKSSILIKFRTVLVLALYLVCTLALAQKPIIRSIVANQGSMGQSVLINGINFGIDDTKITVFFGATQGTIVPPVSDQLIEVQVPAGATFRNISVIRAQSSGPGLVGYSDEQFLLDFNGEHPFDIANLEAIEDFAAEKGLYDLCMCDFNGDKKIDIATANKSSNNVSILINNSSPGTIAFPPKAPATASPTLVAIGAKTLHLTCGDLNGDSRPDIVATSGDDSNRIFILQNMGDGTFTVQTITLNTLGTQKAKIADFDLDGRPDLVITHKKGPPAMLSLLHNNTTGSTIAFDAPIDFSVTGATTTDGIDVADFNGDNKFEIIVGQSLGKDIFILTNTSTSGNISFGDITRLVTTGDGVVNIRVGDLDNDGKPDIAATQVTKNYMGIFLNQGNGTNVSFGSTILVATDGGPWGLDFSDLDGDGKIDISIASITKTNLTILNNESSPGSVSFVKSLVPTTLITRHILSGDLDGDGKPDLAFTSLDDTNPKVSTFRNKTCMIPKISPEEPINVCSGQNVVLTSTVSGGATYTWKNETTPSIVGTNNPVYTIVAPATSTTDYSVTVSPQAGNINCATSKAQVTVVVGNGTAAAPTFSSVPSSPVCTGSTLTLSVNVVANKKYEWTGPNNFTFTGNSVSIPNFQYEMAGKYIVKAVDLTSGCESQEASAVVEAVEAQSFILSYSGADILCEGSIKVLQLSPTSPTFSVQWFNENGSMSGHTSDTLKVKSSGKYFAQVTIPSCGTPKSSTTANITVALKPTIDFTSDPATSACSGQNIQFTNTTNDPNASLTPAYHWTFSESSGSSSSTDANPVHRYNSTNAFTSTIMLSVAYNGIDCGTPKSKTINIVPAPIVDIKSLTNPNFQFCAGQQIKLLLTDSASYLAINWSTGDTGGSTKVHESGTYTVEVTTSSCTLNDDQIVTSVEPSIIVSVQPEEIAEGQSAQLSASGLTSYSWTPTESLSNPSIAEPVANPTVTTTYTVTGEDDNGCTGEKSIELRVIGEPIVNKLKPGNFFSPNGSGPNEIWNVEKIEDYPQCNIAIYDQKGIKVYEAKPYDNISGWDGTFHGKKLPEGVYYFIIRCDGEESKTRSGSITLLR
jgi:gliding motility-associated-like protein